MKYELGLNIESNTFKGGQLTFDLTGVGTNGTKISDITGKSITKRNGFFKFGTGIFLQSEGATPTDGKEYVNGQYTYKYNYQRYSSSWNSNSSQNGWGVMLTDKDSTDSVTTKLCAYINEKPVVNMDYMFNVSTSLSRIYVSSSFIISSLNEDAPIPNPNSSYKMFDRCSSLVDEAGTTYDANYVNRVYAHIDGGTSNPGYFTLKN